MATRSSQPAARASASSPGVEQRVADDLPVALRAAHRLPLMAGFNLPAEDCPMSEAPICAARTA